MDQRDNVFAANLMDQLAAQAGDDVAPEGALAGPPTLVSRLGPRVLLEEHLGPVGYGIASSLAGFDLCLATLGNRVDACGHVGQRDAGIPARLGKRQLRVGTKRQLDRLTVEPEATRP